MTFISTVAEADAIGDVADVYARTRDAMGYLPNYTLTFSSRPEVYRAWSRLIATIRGSMDPRRYELATMGAAVAMQSTYCSLAHAEKLLELGSPQDELVSLSDPDDWVKLEEKDRVIVEFAAKVARSAVSVTEADIDRLRSLGLDDAEILDVVATAAARCFFSKVLDATGTLADARYADELGDLADTLTVGRPIAGPSA